MCWAEIYNPAANRLRADGKDICHVEFRIVDANGVRVPDAGTKATFTMEGFVKLLGMENGDLNSAEPSQDPTRQGFHGHGLAIFQLGITAGKIKITATVELDAVTGD